MTDYVVSDQSLSSVADAIRTKGGTSAPLAFPAGFVNAIQAFPDAMTLDSLSVTENGTYTPSSGHAFSEVTVNVSGGGGGGHEDEDGIIDRTISGTYINNRATKIGKYAFYICSSLTAVSFSLCTTIGSSAFYLCNNLAAVSFPLCTTINGSAFYGCSSLSAASFPLCTTIYETVFYGCNNLTTISFPACTYLSNNAFYMCSKLTVANFPVCSQINSSAFQGCSVMTTVSFPECTRIFQSVFRACTKLLSAYFLGSSVPTLSNSNAFISTPIAGYTASTGGVVGSIYVKASLLTAFQSATNWAYFSSRMVGLTDAQIAALA